MRNTGHASAAAPEAANTDNVSISVRRIKLVAETEPPRRQPVWEPVAREAGGIPSSSEVLSSKHQPQLPAEYEEAMIQSILRPLADGESQLAGNNNREHELRLLLAQLSPIEALSVRRRLDADRSDDRLAVAFRRLIVERRVRLRAYLADPRRGRI